MNIKKHFTFNCLVWIALTILIHTAFNIFDRAQQRELNTRIQLVCVDGDRVSFTSPVSFQILHSGTSYTFFQGSFGTYGSTYNQLPGELCEIKPGI